MLDYMLDFEETEDGYWIKDPTGNRILISE